MPDDNEQTFYKVTNHDIYQKLIDIESQVKATNGRVKLHDLHISGLWAVITAVVSSVVAILVKVFV